MRITVTLMCLLCLGASLSADDKGVLDRSMLDRYDEAFSRLPETEFRINALTNVGIKELSLSRQSLLDHDKRFNHELKSNGITNQRSSGRCWLYAGLNVFTPKAMADLKMDKLELSQAYLAFFDKLEKANCFLEDIIHFRDSTVHSYTMQVVLEAPFGDGGWWHYVTDLVEKYGAVPMEAMPESKQSSSTGRLNNLTSTLLRGYASELRQMHQDGRGEGDLRKRKEEMLGDVYSMLCYSYGPPPKEFDFRYEFKPEKDTTEAEDTDSTATTTDSTDSEEEPYDIVEHHTPMSFYEKYVKPNLGDYIAICNNPAMSMDQLFEFDGGRNIHGQDEMRVLNLPVAKLKQYALASLLDSQIVWFACDVGKENYGDSGIFKRGIYDYSTTFGLDFDLSKSDRISYHDISPNHAMVLRGVDTTDAGVPHRWLVENSWGTKPGVEGEWTMYDSWFNEYVLLVIIDKALLQPDDADKLKMEPEIVPYWEPFFLALMRL